MIQRLAISAALLAAIAATPAQAQRAPVTACGATPGSCYEAGLAFVIDSARVIRTPYEQLMKREDRRLSNAELDRMLAELAPLQQRGIELFAAACEAGHSLSCYAQGRLIHSRGVGDPAVESTAAALYERACHSASAPSASACNQLGEAYYYGMGRPRSTELAVEAYEQGCRLGDATSCFRAAARFAEVPGRAPAEAERLRDEWYSSACDRGSPHACINLVVDRYDRMLLRPPRTEDAATFRAAYERTRETYTTLCEQGVPNACANLGQFSNGQRGPWVLGDGAVLHFPGDREVALRYNRIACLGDTDRGVPDGWACRNVGDLLSRSEPDSALAYYTRGCALFDRSSCAELALILLEDADRFTEGLRILAMTCFEGYGWGCNETGLRFNRNGDADGAAAFYLRACELDEPYGCNNLARHHDRRGDVLLALKYQRRGCDLDLYWACSEFASRLEGLGTRPAGITRYRMRACDAAVAEWPPTAEGVTDCHAAVAGLVAEQRPEDAARYAAQACALDSAYCKRKP